jgi:hypothetical protein
MIGDTGEDISQPGLGVDVIHFRRLCRPPNYAEGFWELQHRRHRPSKQGGPRRRETTSAAPCAFGL